MPPESGMCVPATQLRVVDLPDPFVPITITKEPGAICRSTPFNAFTSLGVPAWKVSRTSRISSMRGHLLLIPFAQGLRQHQCAEYEQRRHQFQIVWIQSP